jgi:hypothetical protein
VWLLPLLRLCRQAVLGAMSDAFASAAKPAKGAFVREALTAGYPKLVALLETAFSRLQADTQVRHCPAAGALITLRQHPSQVAQQSGWPQLV